MPGGLRVGDVVRHHGRTYAVVGLPRPGRARLEHVLSRDEIEVEAAGLQRIDDGSRS